MEGGRNFETESARRIESESTKPESEPGIKTFRPATRRGRIALAILGAAAALGIGAPSDEDIARREREKAMKKDSNIVSKPHYIDPPDKIEPIK